MKPYYHDDAVTLYLGDCREILPHVSADVLVTDPPYGMGYSSGWDNRVILGDHDTSARDGMLEMWGDGPALVFGRWNCPHPWTARACLIWDKGDWPGMGDLSLPWGPSTEEIYVLGKGFVGRRGGSVIRCDRMTGETLHPRKAIGIEIEERYCEIAARRCAQEVMPLDVRNDSPERAKDPTPSLWPS